MVKNTGKAYELFVQRVCTSILRQSVDKLLTLPSTRVVRSAATSHQIDVHWQFERDSKCHTVLIQCKDWAERIPKVEMLAFAKIVDLVGDNTHGVFIAKSGYNSGALEVAKYCGIDVYQLCNPSRDADWDGFIRTITIDTSGTYAGVSEVTPLYDLAWLEEEGRRRGIPTDPPIVLQNPVSARNGYIRVCDEAQNTLGSLGTIALGLTNTFTDDEPRGNKQRLFETPMFIPSGDTRIQWVKVRGVSFHYIGPITRQ